MPIPFFSKNSKESDLFFGLFLKEEEGIGFIFKTDGGDLRLLAKEKFNYSNGWENLTEDVDEILFKLENQTKKTIEKSIFFIYSHLIDEKTKEIKKPFLLKIKDLVKNLELKPVGYVECYEAVVNFLEKKEQLPLTIILIELDKTSLDIFIYKGGHKVFTKIISRTNNIIDDLISVFESIRGEILLPSRIIIYNSTDLTEESTKIISHRWNPDLFVQLPRVEIIREDEVLLGLLDLFQEQINKVKQLKKQVSPEKKEILGFVIGADVESNLKTTEKIKPSSSNMFSLSIVQFINSARSIINTIFKVFAKRNLGLFLGIFLILFSLFLTEYVLHKADLKVFFPSYAVDKDLSFDLEVESASLSADFKESKPTTGKRKIGEKAKGEITIHNFDDKEKIFTKGTVVETDGIKFILEEDVKVASSSLTSDASAKLPGKNKVKVVAVEIGEEGNIDKGERFKIADLSQTLYFAINETHFSGGSEKEVRTVAKKDIEDLQGIVLEKAKEKVKEQTKKKLKKDQKVIDSLTEFSLKEINFSKEVGEEGEKIDITAKIGSTYYFYQNTQLINLIKKSLKEKTPRDYWIPDDKINYQLKKITKNENKINVMVSVKAKILKIINKIIGKNKDSIEKILKDDFQTAGFEINIKPEFLFFKNRLPLFKKNIELRINSL